MINCYRILGVKDFASFEEIKTAYRKLSKKFHPDVNDGDKFFEEKFKEIQNAYEVLCDSLRKEVHDSELKNFSASSSDFEFNEYNKNRENTTDKATNHSQQNTHKQKKAKTTYTQRNYDTNFTKNRIRRQDYLSYGILFLIFVIQILCFIYYKDQSYYFINPFTLFLLVTNLYSANKVERNKLNWLFLTLIFGCFATVMLLLIKKPDVVFDSKRSEGVL